MSKTASRRQAERLAHMHFNDAGLHMARDADGYTDPTTKAIIKRGWADKTDKTVKYPNGSLHDVYKLNQTGLGALASFILAEWRRTQ